MQCKNGTQFEALFTEAAIFKKLRDELGSRHCCFLPWQCPQSSVPCAKRHLKSAADRHDAQLQRNGVGPCEGPLEIPTPQTGAENSTAAISDASLGILVYVAAADELRGGSRSPIGLVEVKIASAFAGVA